MSKSLNEVRIANILKLIASGFKSKKEFAKKVGIGYSSIVNKLNGHKNYNITADNARKIEKALGLDFSSLDMERNLPAVVERNTTELFMMTDNISIRATLDLNNPEDVKIRKLIAEIMNLRGKS